VSERKDHFTLVPRRFTDAHIADELDAVHVLIGLHVAARCYEVINTSGGVAPIRLAPLAELCEVSEETVRRRLHDLRDWGWLGFEAPVPGQRSAWRIWLLGLAHEGGDSTRAPQTCHRPTTETPPRPRSSSSTAATSKEGAIPHGEKESTSTRAPQSDSAREDKRNETKRNEKSLTEEKLDHVVGETTAAASDRELLDRIWPSPPLEGEAGILAGCQALVDAGLAEWIT